MQSLPAACSTTGVVSSSWHVEVWRRGNFAQFKFERMVLTGGATLGGARGFFYLWLSFCFLHLTLELTNVHIIVNDIVSLTTLLGSCAASRHSFDIQLWNWQFLPITSYRLGLPWFLGGCIAASRIFYPFLISTTTIICKNKWFGAARDNVRCKWLTRQQQQQ